MNYRAIEIFLDLVETRNITRTAQRLYLSQSTVSKRLQTLEEELGCSLIYRTKGKRGILLTRQGEQFITIAERWKNLYEETESLKSASFFTITIGISESVYYGMIAPFIRIFLEKHPEVRIVANIFNSDQIYDLLDRNLLDYGIAAYESERAGIKRQCVGRQQFCVIRYDEHPVSEKYITAEELDPTKEIRFTGGNFRGMNRWRKEWFGDQMKGRLELNTIQGIVPFLKESDYWALCTMAMAESIAKDISIQIYQLEGCENIWEIFFLKKEVDEAKKPSVSVQFEEELLAYIKEYESKNNAKTEFSK